MLCVVGVGTNGDDLAAELFITHNNVFTGMQVVHPFFDATGVDFDSLFVFNQVGKNLIKNILVFCITVIFIQFGTVPHHIIQMSADIKIREGFDILIDAFKIFAEGFLLGATLKIAGVIGVFSMA